MRVRNMPAWSDLIRYRVITLGAFLSLAGLALLLIFTFISHWQLDRYLQKLEETRQAISHAEKISSAFSVSHSYHQLFQVTGHEAHRQESGNAFAKLERELENLIQLSEKNSLSWLQGEVNTLQQSVQLYKQHQMQGDFTMQPISTKGTSLPAVIHISPKETPGIHPLTASVDQVKNLLAANLVSYEATVHGVKRRVWYLNLSSGMLALGIIGYAFGLVWQEKRERLATEKNLTELNINKDKFFSIVSHDLRGPVANIVKLAEFMQEEGLGAGDYRMMAGHLHKSAQSLHKLLENLLSWARLQMGRVECKPEAIDLHQLAQESISQVTNIAADKNITVQNDVPEGTLAFADEKMCDTVLRNLLLNAIKFTHAKGNVRVHTAESKDSVELCVSDTGVGMTSEVMGRLFQLGCHFTSKGTANEPGSGLGLILCKELVEKNKGQIGVASELNKGSTFMVTLPKAVV